MSFVTRGYTMSKLFTFSLLFFSFYFVACSSIVHKKKSPLPKNKIYAIGSFWNYTQTPMAGLRAASIVESILANRPIKLISLIQGDESSLSKESKAQTLLKQKSQAKRMGAIYLITGEVQEWRYKSGIDAEPVVSYSIKVIDLQKDRTIFNAVGAKSGLGYKSVGIIAQEIAQEITPNFIE